MGPLGRDDEALLEAQVVQRSLRAAAAPPLLQAPVPSDQVPTALCDAPNAIVPSTNWFFAAPEGDEGGMQLSSTKKKRRMKMNKHKRRKRRKKNRLKKRFK